MFFRDRTTHPALRALRTAAIVGGFLLFGVFLWLIATADAAEDPLDRPDYANGAAKIDVKQRFVDAGDPSRDADRLSTLPSRYHALVQKRKEAREARREARVREAQQEARTPVVVSAPVETKTPNTGNPGGGSSGTLPDLLLFIRANESGGNYQAYNPSGCEGYGCYGAYQLHGYYMDDWARRYGEAAWAGTPANQWPPGVQDKVALGLFYSTNPDGAHWCDWTSYC